jgi:hypothetical protein
VLSTNVSSQLLLHRSGYYRSEHFLGPCVLPDTLTTEMYCNRHLDSLLNSWLRLIKWQPAVHTVLSQGCCREVLIGLLSYPAVLDSRRNICCLWNTATCFIADMH